MSEYQILSDAQLEEIHQASLEILRRTGVRVHDAEVVEMLAGTGSPQNLQGRLVNLLQLGIAQDLISAHPSTASLSLFSSSSNPVSSITSGTSR